MGTHPIFESDFDCLTEVFYLSFVPFHFGPVSESRSVCVRESACC